MRTAIISEQYRRGVEDGGLHNVREALRDLFPEARFFVLGGRYYPNGFFSAWRAALRAENLDLREFELVITLGTGFASGVITQPSARHIAFFFGQPLFSNERGLAGHWYRVWSVQMAERVDRWVANSQFVSAAIAKYFRKEASVVYSFGEAAALPTRSNPGAPREAPRSSQNGVGAEWGGDNVVLIAEAGDARTRDACRVACERSGVTPLFVGGELARKPEERQRLLGRTFFLVVPTAVSFSSWIPEALALGRPVLCCRGAGLPEYVEEGVTGLFFDDVHPGVIADGMRRMRERLTDFKPEALKVRAAQFSREHFRGEFLKVLEGVIQ